MIEELKIEDIEKATNLKELGNGNVGLFFHLPGHCAGCTRALKAIEKIDHSNWNILLVNADEDAYRPLINHFSVSTAPTFVYTTTNSDSVFAKAGLKQVLDCKELFG